MDFPALRFEQVQKQGSASTIYLFAAPSSKIMKFAGIPRKEVKDPAAGETIGYQRPQSDRKLKQYLKNDLNIIPTSILLATRDSSMVTFKAKPSSKSTNENTTVGILSISEPNENEGLNSLLERLLEVLEARYTPLKEIEPNPELVLKAKRVLPSELSDVDNDLSEDDSDDSQEENDSNNQPETANQVAEAVYAQNANIQRFYEAAKSALQAIAENNLLAQARNVLGFSPEMLSDFLKPTIVVDGQHRLLGCNDVLSDKWLEYEQTPDFAKRFDIDKDSNAIISAFKEDNDRWLSVCLMANDDWSEHVFQFVVVNQKAKSINKDLLASIVSTSLTEDELNAVKPRLGDASIQIEDVQLVGILRTDSGPFQNVIKAGFDTKDETKEKGKLDHSSAIKIFRLFRDLKGAKDPTDTARLDAAYKWRDTFLESYEGVQDYETKGFSSALNFWSDRNGPWREVFTYFYQAVKDNLVVTASSNASWGDTGASNLFNQVTLLALGIQFFCYLDNRQKFPQTFSNFKKEIDFFVGTLLNKEFFMHEWDIQGRRVDQPNVKRLHTNLKVLWHVLDGKIVKGKFRGFFKD